MSNPLNRIGKMFLTVAVWIFILSIFMYIGGLVIGPLFTDNTETLEMANEALKSANITIAEQRDNATSEKVSFFAEKVDSITTKHNHYLKTKPSSYRVFLLGALVAIISFIFFFAAFLLPKK